MKKFTQIRTNAAPWLEANIDTDIIIPKQFLKTVKRTGLGVYAFNDRRYDENGNKNPDFVLNKQEYKDAQILISGENFGCGSSREHAVWAIMDMGIRAIIAPSFADIFKTNATKNGLLLIALPQNHINYMAKTAEDIPESLFLINLKDQKISLGDKEFSFEIDSFVKKCFLEGLDDIALTLEKEDKIAGYESVITKEKPWLLQSFKST